MNDSKTEFLVFGTRYNLNKHTIPPLKVGDSDINKNKNENFLQVLLDQHLTFKDHITNKSKIALYNLSLIDKIRNFLTADQLKMFMCSLVFTHSDYSNSILVNSQDAITKQLQLVQNLAAKLYNRRKQESATKCLNELHWLPVKFKSIYKLLTTVYTSLKKEGPTYLQTKLNLKHSQRSTRHSAQDSNTLNLVTPFIRRKIYTDRGFTVTATQQ